MIFIEFFLTHGFNPFSTNWYDSTLDLDDGKDGEWYNEPMKNPVNKLFRFIFVNVFNVISLKYLNNVECENKLCFLQINYVPFFLFSV